jgi:hypothetical protein
MGRVASRRHLGARWSDLFPPQTLVAEREYGALWNGHINWLLLLLLLLLS